MLLLVGGVALSFLIPLLSALWATVVAAAGLILITGFNFAVWTQADMVLPLATSILMVGVPLHDEHGVRVFRRVALQAPVHRTVRPIRAPGTRRPDGLGSGEVHHGAEGGRADDPVFGRSGLHRHFRDAQARGTARIHERVPHRDERHHPLEVPRNPRQVHRRRDHGVLGRARRRCAARAQRRARRAGHAEGRAKR